MAHGFDDANNNSKDDVQERLDQLYKAIARLDCLIKNTENFPEMQKYKNQTDLNETDLIATMNQPDFLVKFNQTAQYCITNSQKYFDEFKRRFNISEIK